MNLIEKRYTVEDYEKLPEGSPYQPIEGEPNHMPRKNLGGGALVLYATNVYQPDLVVLLSHSLKKLTHREAEEGFRSELLGLEIELSEVFESVEP